MLATDNMFETNSISLPFSEHFFVFFFSDYHTHTFCSVECQHVIFCQLIAGFDVTQSVQEEMALYIRMSAAYL